MVESWIVVVRERHGKRIAERKPLHVPLLLAVGQLEKMSDLHLREAIRDLQAEFDRRNLPTDPTTTGDGYDPFASQYRG